MMKNVSIILNFNILQPGLQQEIKLWLRTMQYNKRRHVLPLFQTTTEGKGNG